MLQDVTHNLQAKLAVLNGLRTYAPAWAVSLVIVIVALAVALVAHATILVVLRRVLDGRPYLRTIVEATKEPTRLAFLLAALAIALPTAPVDSDTEIVLGKILVLATVGLIGWIALTVLRIAANLYLLRWRLDVEDNLLARKHVTQVRILVRALDTVIVLITVGCALMTFDSVRQYGVSLFASAGVAGVVFGLAAQPVLSNLIAGVQLAVTQPIRLEDAVTVQNEYGWIEEINATYVVIRPWDLRRLIVPLNFFIQQPFYNWTRRAPANLGSVLLYLDYTAPVDRIREKAGAVVAESKVGGTLINVQVTNASVQAMEVRVLLKADDASNASDLCVEVREKLIAFLQREYPDVLPRQRNEIIEAPGRKMGEPPPVAS
ncbi:MAG TPA: mechanosensitive ion channel family protein [Xanthobacteraceae bacterium]|jgi:small-conductance mechanosensitive channel|nr:mechanosensitive ion channel family protein [Xanthobacteraceae bacterium]